MILYLYKYLLLVLICPIVSGVNIQCEKAYKPKNLEATSSMPYFDTLGLGILFHINE